MRSQQRQEGYFRSIGTSLKTLANSSKSARRVKKDLKATLHSLPAESADHSVRLLQQELQWLLKLSSKHTITQSLERLSADLQRPAAKRLSAVMAGYLEVLADAARNTRLKAALNALAQDFRTVPLRETSVARPKPQLETPVTVSQPSSHFGIGFLCGIIATVAFLWWLPV